MNFYYIVCFVFFEYGSNAGNTAFISDCLFCSCLDCVWVNINRYVCTVRLPVSAIIAKDLRIPLSSLMMPRYIALFIFIISV